MNCSLKRSAVLVTRLSCSYEETPKDCGPNEVDLYFLLTNSPKVGDQGLWGTSAPLILGVSSSATDTRCF